MFQYEYFNPSQKKKSMSILIFENNLFTLPLFTPISTGFPHFLSGSLFLPRLHLCLCPLFFFFSLRSPSTQAALPFLQSTPPNPSPLHYSLWSNHHHKHSLFFLWMNPYRTHSSLPDVLRRFCGSLGGWWLRWVAVAEAWVSGFDGFCLPWPPWLLGFVRRSHGEASLSQV